LSRCFGQNTKKKLFLLTGNKEKMMKKQDQKKLAENIVADLITARKQSENIGEDLIELMNMTNEDFENPLTEEIEKQMDILEGNDLAELKESIRTELQPRLKMKQVQSAILDQDDIVSKTHKITIKKVNSKMVGHKDFPQFSNEDLGRYKVVLEKKKAKEEPEVQTFDDALQDLMDEFGKTIAETRVTLDNLAGTE